MQDNEINKSTDTKKQEQPVVEKAPDERSGIYLQGHIKIFDPETQEVFMNGRA
jgi:hypothetical protein